MKKAVLLFSLVVLFSVASNAQISVPLPQKKAQQQVLSPIEMDALHNLDVAEQYFIKKRHVGALERSSEAIVAVESGGIQFAKMDALLYYAGMSSYYLATGRGKQKIDVTKLSEENKKKYAPETLREEAIAYLSTLVEKYPQSKYKEEAAKALKELESTGAATK
jgi:outer membrane protein assembly factor BamD (BamD/ComL family)